MQAYGDRWILGLDLGKGRGVLIEKYPGVVVGDRLTCSSAWNWSDAGYFWTHPIQGATPLVRLHDKHLANLNVNAFIVSYGVLIRVSTSYHGRVIRSNSSIQTQPI